MTLVSYDTIALRETCWRELVDSDRPTLAALVPTARDGATRPALRASLRTLNEHFGAETTAFSLGLALHLRLAERHSRSLTEWKMAAQAEGIEIPDGLDWTQDGVVRDIVLLHQKLYDDGLHEGAALGRREALLDVAAAIASDEQLARLRSIDDVGELAVAVKALLAR